MNIKNLKINFCAGYDDPNRTIKKKYSDYKAINEEMKKYNLLNEDLTKKIRLLEEEIFLTVKSYQNVLNENEIAVQNKIANLKEEIRRIKQQIEENQDTANALWYSFHERL